MMDVSAVRQAAQLNYACMSHQRHARPGPTNPQHITAQAITLWHDIVTRHARNMSLAKAPVVGIDTSSGSLHNVSGPSRVQQLMRGTAQHDTTGAAALNAASHSTAEQRR